MSDNRAAASFLIGLDDLQQFPWLATERTIVQCREKTQPFYFQEAVVLA